MPEIMTIPAMPGAQAEDLEKGVFLPHGVWLSDCWPETPTGPGLQGPLLHFIQWERLDSFLSPGPS